MGTHRERLDRRRAAGRSSRRSQLLLERELAAARRRQTGVALRPPQTLPLAVGDRIVGTLRERTAAL